MGERQKETLSPNNYFGGKGGEGRVEGGYNLRSRHFPWQVMSLSRPLTHHVKLGTSYDWQSRGSYLMTIG